jgi:formylglycine-generating enzyme required for sulfatase activity
MRPLRAMACVSAAALTGCLGDTTSGLCAGAGCTTDAAPPTPDAAPPTTDAAPPTPDAAPPTPDAPPPPPDAAPDAAPPTPDAAPLAEAWPASAPCRAEPMVVPGDALAPGGTFEMGAIAGGGTTAENEPHRVSVAGPFIVQQREVTRRHWAEALNDHVLAPGTAEHPRWPVTGVSWYAALVYANQASIQDSLSPCYHLEACRNASDADGRAMNLTASDFRCDRVITADACDGWRLPTEAEWEYAARAGGAYAPEDAQAAGFHAGNSGGEPHEAFEVDGAHPWGLSDVLGNVREWTFDCYRAQLGPDTVGDCVPAAKPEKAERVVRGGGFRDAMLSLSMRHAVHGATGTPDAAAFADIGFRLVRTPRACRAACTLAATAPEVPGQLSGSPLRPLAPMFTFQYPRLPEIYGIGAADRHVLLTFSDGLGISADRTYFRLIDVNADAPQAAAEDVEVGDFQPAVMWAPLRVRANGVDHPEFVAVGHQKNDACIAAGAGCATLAQRIDPTRPTAEAPPVALLHRSLSIPGSPISFLRAGREADFVVVAATPPEAIVDDTPQRVRVFGYRVTADAITPTPEFADAPEGREVSFGGGCIAKPTGLAVDRDGGRLLVVASRVGDCRDWDGSGRHGTFVRVLDLAGRPVDGVPLRRLGDGEFRPDQAQAPIELDGDAVLVVLHDATTSTPAVHRFSLDELLAVGAAEAVAPLSPPIPLGAVGAELLGFQVLPEGVLIALKSGIAGDMQWMSHGVLGRNGTWVRALWPVLPAQGGGRVLVLPDGRLFAAGSGYRDHTVYAGLYGCY